MESKGRIQFDPEAPYTLQDAARILGHSADWVKRNAIKSGDLQFCPMGDHYVVMGRWITDYVVMHGTHFGDENCSGNSRGKHKKPSSPPKKTGDEDATS